jgi:hypothetical protein
MVPPKIESSLDNVRSMEDVSLVVRSPNRRRKRSSLRSSDDDSSAAAVIILGLLLYNMVDRNNG